VESSRKNREYSAQFKQQAMDLVRVEGRDPTVAARDLGMPATTLCLWLRKAGWVRQEEGSEGPLPEDPMALKLKVAELQRQVKRLEMEKEILKKATAFFAGQSL
jgi:transposase